MVETEKKTEKDGFVDLFDLNPDDFGAEVTKTEKEDITSEEDDVEELDTEVEETKAEEKSKKKPSSDEEDKEEEEEKEKKEETEEEEKEEDTEEDKEEVSEVGSLLEELAEDGVFEFDPEKEYEPNASGLKEIVQETVNKAKSKFLDEFIEKSDADTKEALEVIKSGGSINEYFQSKNDVDFLDVPIVTDDGEPIEKNQKHLVEDWLKIQGYESDEIEEKISDWKEAGLLEKEATTSKKKLAKWQESEKEKVKASRIQDREQQQKDLVKAQEEFKKSVTSKREIAGFKISEKEAEKLHEFITKPTRGGKTAFAEKDTEDTRLLYAYLAMKDFNKEALEKEVKSKQNLKLKKKLSNYSDKNAKRTSGEKRVQNNSKSDKLDFEWLV